MPRRLSLAILLVSVLSAGAAAQPDAQQRPTRDRTLQVRRPVGTASITGHVTSGDTGRPIARARITASSPELPDGSIATLTDLAGVYLLADLPPGTYSVTATKTAFVSLAYGAQRSQAPGKRLTVTQGQQLRDVDIRLPRGSVITGRVYDDGGEPIVRATVRSMRYQYLQGEPRLVSGGSAQTDDRGQFRIYGLVPGSYIVTAAAPTQPAPERNGRLADPSFAQSYAPTYYPGVMNPAEAGPILLGLQQEYANVDFMLQMVASARVSGTVLTEAGTGTSAMVMLVADDPRGAAAGSTYGGRVQNDGSFTISGVPPGRYVAVARAAAPMIGRRAGLAYQAAAGPLVGLQPVTVAGQDVTGLSILLSAGGTIAGWVTLESAADERPDLGHLRLSTVPPRQLPFVGSQSARIQPDGSFTISNVVAGSHLLRVSNLPKGWALKGVYLGSRDVSDQAVDVRTGQTLGDLQVVLTDRVTTIAGTVIDGQSAAVSDCDVVLFPADPTRWQPRSRSILGGQPDQTGTYRFSGVPPGDYYLAAARGLEPGAWYDPSLLEELRKGATRVAVEEGDTKTVTLKMATTGQ